MAGNAARRRKLTKQLEHSLLVLSDVGKILRVSTFKIHIGDDRGSAMARSGHIDNIEVIFVYQPVQVNINEIQSGRCPPVTQQTRLDVFSLERLFQKRVSHQID